MSYQMDEEACHRVSGNLEADRRRQRSISADCSSSVTAFEEEMDHACGRAEKAMKSVLGHPEILDDASRLPESPKDWTTAKKVVVNIVFSLFVLSLTYSSTAVIPSIPAVMTLFRSSHELATLSVTLNIIGVATAPMIFAPLSEIFGRRPIYVVAGALYSLCCIMASESTGIAMLLSTRLLAGFFGAVSVTLVPASIADYTRLENRNRYTIVYAVSSFIGPPIGNLVGVFVETAYPGARTNLRVIAAFALATSTLVSCIPETYSLPQQKSNPRINSADFLSILRSTLCRPFRYLFTQPAVALVAIYLTLLNGILYTFLKCLSLIFVDLRHFSPQEYALSYFSMIIGFVLGGLILSTVADRIYLYYSRIANEKGTDVPPIARLSLACIGGVLCPVSLFIFAFTASNLHIHSMIPLLALSSLSLSVILIFVPIVAEVMDIYEARSASALAATLFARSIIGSFFPLFALKMYEALTIPGATSLLAGLASLAVALPFFFVRYGDIIRRKSRESCIP